jgi:DNA mismatch repair protein MutL
MTVKLLSQDTINKIAAGEVVERPLNVVKELIENSLDACANSINTEIAEAGKKLIRVSDNGIGMDKEDLKLSVLRHATSKISTFDDLSYIQSMGFRGEALSSIAAVSNLEIKTRQKDQPSGWKMTIKGGSDIQLMPWDGAQGSIFEVKDLFFNTPARQKFLKSDSTEKGRIINAIEEIALANFDSAFKLTVDSKTIIQTAASKEKINRISDILGRDFAHILRNVKIDNNKVSLDIYYTGRNNAQPNRKYQYLFVNLRPVNIPKWLIYLLNKAYQENIERGKYPGFLIYITIDPSDIDVNIHPAKREIKFVNEGALYDLIDKTIRSGLESHSYPNLNMNVGIDKNKDIEIGKVAQYSKTDFPTDRKFTVNEQSSIYQPSKKQSFVPTGSSNKKYSLSDYANVYVEQKLKADDFDNDIKIIGQAFDTYIIAQKDDKFYIFDQHAAAERVKYEQFLLQCSGNKLNIQQILIPETFELAPSEANLLKENMKTLNELGIEIEEFGDKSFRVKAYPAILGQVSAEQIVKTIFKDLEYNKNIEIEKKREIIIRSACRASVKAGDKLSLIEAKYLILELFKCSKPFTCPHGRPTAYEISKQEIEKYFKRI